MNIYTHRSPGALFSGPGSIKHLGDLLKEHQAKNAVLICDEGIKNAGLHERALDAAKSAGAEITVLSTAEPEPTAFTIGKISETVKKGSYDYVIGLGGGSSLDTAKLAASLAVNEGEVIDYLGINLIPQRGLPTVMIPTTSGTGSEVTPNAIVSLPDEGRKAGAVSRYLVPDTAILDSELTIGLPASITASTGLDALIHCLESYIGKKANTLSDGFALQGIRLIAESLSKAFHHGDDAEARERMLIGACFGGMALTASGTAAVHALAYATGARYHIPHGVANSMLLVPVLERSLAACETKLRDVGRAMGIGPVPNEVLVYLKALAEELEIPSTLATYGYKEDDLDDLVGAALKVTRLLENNPKPLSADDIREIFVSIGGK